ncbi:MAG TPA: class I SAM-dependent methyltransferase [Gammaproteobacteria bacterium]|nr:class I SAM-dependent methyltransferase [Gammaproteobacteria bacterium]
MASHLGCSSDVSERHLSAGLPPGNHSAAVGRQILQTVLGNREVPVAFRLWDGSSISTGKHDCTLVFTHPGVLRDLVLHRDVYRLGEAYLNGELAVEGNLETVFDLPKYLGQTPIPLSTRLSLLYKALRLPASGTRRDARRIRAGFRARRNSQSSIAHHYDVGNDFYRLWLDPQMVYSCAYFRDETQSLADAQCDKLDYLCRKLRLRPGQRLLDIGCGWGALLLWAARHYGVKAHGITLSEEQYRFARERIAAEKLQDQVSVELRDYRDLNGEPRYDRVVSVGMFEHVGIENFPVYFGAVRKMLAPDGLFLNHGITNDTGWRKTPLTRFINRYVFPDGELARISDVSTAMEEAGFEILDVEGLRRHYALTLRHWTRALEEKRDLAIQVASAPVYRLWRLYMTGSAYYFDEGSINVYQILAGHAHSYTGVPLRRSDIYTDSA